jgi:glutamate synthase (NADPH/NADH) large chain
LKKIPHFRACRKTSYKGMPICWPEEGQLGSYFKDLHRSALRERARARAPALLDQHLPVLGCSRTPTGWSPITARSTRARQRQLDGGAPGFRGFELFGADLNKLWPISYEGQSDTACFDNALEFLVQGGYSLAHAVMMLIPEAWAGNPLMDEERRAFYEYHAALMEPWDGPAACRLHRRPPDRRDARPQRPAPGALPRHRRRTSSSWRPNSACCRSRRRASSSKWRLQPGKMLLIDLEAGPHHLRRGDQARARRRHPYKEWLKRTQIVLEGPEAGRAAGVRRTCRCSIASRPSATPRKTSRS